ncbi:MAG: NDP-sugar synthase [Thermoprotei archaeon]
MVILAGGMSTRLRPITNTRPKMLVPIVNKPIIEHVLDRVRESGLGECHFTLNYMSDKIVSAISDGRKLGIRALYHKEETPLGTAGSVKAIEQELDDVFVVLSGDILFDFQLQKVLKEHLQGNRVATMVLAPVSDVSQFGVALLDKNSRVTGFVEKPNPRTVSSNLVNTGIYVLNRSVLKKVRGNMPVDFSRDVFPQLVKEGALNGHIAEGFWYDIGTFAGLLKAQRSVLAGETKIKIEGKEVVKGVYFQGEPAVEDMDSLLGPAVIADGAHVGARSTLRFATLGEEVKMGEKTTVVESSLMKGVWVGQEAIIAGGVLGERCTVASYASIIGPAGYQDGSII